MAKLTKSQRSELINDVHNFGIDFEAREIYIGGNEVDEIDHVLSTTFLINIRLLDKTDGNILIHMNSVGGEWAYGMGMYDAIKSCKNKIILLAYAHARSMSSIIPQAADIRVIMPNAYFMVHEGTLGIEGTEKSIRSFVDFNKEADKSMLDIYAQRCKDGVYFKNWKEEKIKKFIKTKMNDLEEWYITARASVEYGFMDAVLGDSGYESIEIIKNL